MALSFQVGSYPDVVATPTGVALVSIVAQSTMRAQAYTTSQTPTTLWTQTVAGAEMRSTRCACNTSTGEVRAIFHYNTAPGVDHAYIASAAGIADTGLDVNVPERGVCLTFEAGDFVAYVCDSKFTYIRYPLSGVPSAPIANPFPTTGSLLGMRDVLGGVPQWDEDPANPGTYAFTTLGGQDFYHYNTRGTVTVGQTKGPPTTSEGIIAWDGTVVTQLTTTQGFNPHVAIVTAGMFAGQAIVVWRSVDVTIQPTPGTNATANIGFATGLQGSAGTGLSNLLSGLYRIPVLEKQGGIMSLPWYNYFVRQAQGLATPINLASNDVTGILPGSNLPFDPAFLVVDLGLLTGLTGDVEATGPGIAEATIVRQYVPMTTGAIPGEVLFIGPDVMLIKADVP